VAAPVRRWRTALVGVIAGMTLPMATQAGPAFATPANPADTNTASRSAAAATRAVAAKVAPAVRTRVSAKGKSTFWVVLDGRADLSGARAAATKTAKATDVYRDATAFARSSQAGLRSLLDNRKADYTPYWISNRVKVTGDAKLLGEIASRDDVTRVEADTPVALPKPTVNAQRLREVNGVEWNIDRINAPRVWNELGVRGEGIVVASIDSGVKWDHPALVGTYRGRHADGTVDHNYSWFDPAHACPTAAPCDTVDHGTHTMGTMVGDDGTNQVGGAPGATWVAAKGCETSSCSQASLLAAAQWVVAPTNIAGAEPRPDLAPDVVNNSWGGTIHDTWYADVVSAWVTAGIFPSFANGNAGPGCNSTGSPGDYVSTYSSGAFDVNNTVASFSSRGTGENGETKPNISAPGVNVRSSVPSGYASFSGTSMATPHTTATVALMWSAAPALRGDVAETRRLLDTTASDVNDTSCGGTAADNDVFGEGRLDAYAAVLATPRGALGGLGGTVTSGGQPLGGTTVTATGPITRTAATGADGRYSFANLSVGEYAVKATKFGYVTAAGTATVAENGTATLDLVRTVPESVAVAA
jgi:subtilisin family serine protease